MSTAKPSLDTTDKVNPIKTTKNKKERLKQKMQSGMKSKTFKLTEQKIYNKQIIRFRVRFDFNQIGSFMKERIMNYARKYIMGKCHKEGYVSTDHVDVINYTSALLQGNNVYYDVDYEFNVLYPYEGMELFCKIQNITKIGIKGIISNNDNENPIVAFASRIHNQNIFTEDDEQDVYDEQDSIGYKIGDIIKVSTLGHRFEINDPHVSLLVKILENK
jgi:hypothetical protein